jgi:hypothetical protein
VANTGKVTQSVILAASLQNGTAKLTQSFIIAAVALGVSCNNPPPGVVGIPYSHTFLTGGGDPPLVFSSSGFVPAGLTLDPTTGILSGVPTVGGSFVFQVTVTDSLNAVASVTCSIGITFSSAIVIQFVGWKLYPDEPCGDVEPGIELLPVKRAV